MNRNRILIVLLAFCAVLIMPLSAQARQAGPMVAHAKVMTPAGEYVVYVFKGSEWKEAGKLSFNKFFRTETLDLSKFITGHGDVKIRLVEKGGGAAHIDAVFLGDSPPGEVKGLRDTLALKKLGKKDFDVVDAFKKSVELTFPGGQSKVMSLTARVEGTRLSKMPFQFPLSNIARKMTAKSAFYHYRLTTGEASGNQDRADMTQKPFFKEYSDTGSGHPSGYTYGWVRNDNKNLYVTIDFTPDDTMDGAKDYSKVYAKTKEGLKEFKVSVPETKWGHPDFTYTDKVAYQHKVYDFKIPLEDLGLTDANKKDELQLAFAAYGTASINTSICRGPGFWGTHAGDQKNNSVNITQDVISVAGECSCLSVCGMAINNTELSNMNSALEALCVSPKSDIQLQLISQLTAATLNCVVSRAGYSSESCSTCSYGFYVPTYQPGVIDIGELVEKCNDACADDQTTASVTPVGGSKVTVNCIDALNCFNNGGLFSAGTGPATATCNPVALSCASRPLCLLLGPNISNLCFDADAVGATCPQEPEPNQYCSPTPGPAGSSKLCHEAIKNDCILGGDDCATATAIQCED